MTTDVPPDKLGAQLVALGLIRATADGMLPDPAATADERFRRCAELVETWVGGPSAGERGELRAPLLTLLDVLARTSALYLVVALGDSTEEAEKWLAEQSAKAGDDARRAGDDHPAGPLALALTWLHVEALAEGEPDTEEERERLDRERIERHAGRCDRYVREEHVTQDAYTLVLTTARLAATILVRLAGDDRAVVEKELDDQAAQLLDGHTRSEVPAWVPGDVAALVVRYRASWSDPESYQEFEPTFATVAEAQQRCEEEFRAQMEEVYGDRDKADQVVCTWEVNDPHAPILWEMRVQTPTLTRAGSSPVNSGFAVTVAGGPYDGGRGHWE
ncbi:hypothetical protein ACFVUY_38155 [Kitasatospora sp. NPDC058063]|uniref:hypothetical protein n=1 Tax=unclassified Kitasatospora TaxID=2633591 RepID=UPI0036D9565E